MSSSWLCNVSRAIVGVAGLLLGHVADADPTNDEAIVVVNRLTDSVVFHARGADGNVVPELRVSGGTGLALTRPFGVLLDRVHDELVAVSLVDDSIAAFDLHAPDVETPLRVLKGEGTRLSSPNAIVVDYERDLLIVANTFGQTVNIYRRVAIGNEPPVRSIAGPNTALAGPWRLALDRVNGELYVSNITSEAVTVYPIDAGGDVTPVRVLAGPDTRLEGPRGLAVDSINDELFVASVASNAVYVYRRTAAGNEPPLRALTGASTRLVGPVGVQLDSINDELVVLAGNRLLSFDRTASGDVAPLREISGNRARLVGPNAATVTSRAPLAAAVLPGSRSTQLGQTVTAFATLINAGSGPAIACAPALPGSLPVIFGFQQTDAQNVPVGAAMTPVNVPAGASSTFVISLAPQAVIETTTIDVRFVCDHTLPAATLDGVNTFTLSASVEPVADVVAVAATQTNDGIVAVEGAGVFTVAAVNVGASEVVRITADTGGVELPLTLLICQTDPASSACLSEPVFANIGVALSIDHGTTPTFGVFAFGETPVSFDPARHRIFVRFSDDAARVRGVTSVAVTVPART